MDEFNPRQDTLLDRSLNELPFAPLPADFTRDVMAAVQAAQREAAPATPTRFRLQFLDIALAVFWSVVLAFIWAFTLWWTGVLHFKWLPAVQASFSLFDPLSAANPALLLGGIMLLLLELCLLVLVGVNLWGERPSTQQADKNWLNRQD